MATKDIEAGRAHVLVQLRDKVTGGLKKVERSLSSFGQSMATAGTALAVTAGGPLAKIMTVFAGFDSQMARVGAITNATEGDMALLREEAKRLGATTQFTASQAAEGMVFLGMAGYNTSQILKAIGPVLSVASAGMLDLGRAADIVSDAQTAFGLTADQAVRVADVLARTATSSNTSIEQMGEAFTYAAAQGKAAGQTIESVSAALGILGNSGLKASIAGTGVQGIFKRLIQPDALESLRMLGVSLADAAGNIRPLSALMADLQRSTSRMTQLKKLQTFEELFGLHSKSAIILADNATALAEMEQKLYKADGAATDMAGKIQNSVMGSWLGLMSAVESVSIALGEALAGPVRAVADVMIAGARGVAAFVNANRRLFQVLGIIAGVAATVGVALAGIGLSAMAAGFVAGGLAMAIKALASAALFLFSPLGVVLVLLTGLAVAAWHYGDKLMTALEPIAAKLKPIITALQEMWTVFVQTFGAIVAYLQSGSLENAAGIAWLGFVAVAWTAIEQLGAAINVGLDFLQSWIPGVATVRDFMHAAFGSIADAIIGGRWDLAGQIAMAKLQLVWTQGIDVLKDGWDVFVFAAKNTFISLTDFIEDIWQGAVNGIASGITWIMEKLGMAAEGAVEELERMQKAEAEAKAAERAKRPDLAQAMGSKLMEREQQRNAMLAHISELEKQAAKAGEQAGGSVSGRAEIARADLQKAIEAAKAFANQPPGDAPKPEQVLKQQVARAGTQMGKLSTIGTFSAAAAGILGNQANKDEKEIASNTRIMARVLKQIDKNTQQQGVTA